MTATATSDERSPQSAPVVLTKPSTTGERAAEWVERIRDFHLTGEAPEAQEAEDWVPAAPLAWLRGANSANAFPLHYQAVGDPDFQCLRDVIGAALEAAGKSAEGLRFLEGRRDSLTSAVREVLDKGTTTLAEALPAALVIISPDFASPSGSRIISGAVISRVDNTSRRQNPWPPR